MNKTVIITGGAGFIGCALSEGVSQRYSQAVAIDCLHPQFHPEPVRPAALDSRVELFVADICDESAWNKLLENITLPFDVIHLAAETGTSQSLSDASRHALVNVVGTTRMLDAFILNRKFPDQILLTSSRAVYGEGAWQKKDESVFYPGQRSDEMLRSGQWDFSNARPLPFCAQKTTPHPTNIYGATKLAQENILSAWTSAYGTKCKILRLQNVYGPGQSLVNPYTGVVSLFVQKAKSGESIPLYEDGEITRDFVYISDVISAVLLAIESKSADKEIYDIGTGLKTTIRDIAHLIAAHYNTPAPHVCGKYRNGDVRHASCDISTVQQVLQFKPDYSLTQGIEQLCKWIDAQNNN